MEKELDVGPSVSPPSAPAPDMVPVLDSQESTETIQNSLSDEYEFVNLSDDESILDAEHEDIFGPGFYRDKHKTDDTISVDRRSNRSWNSNTSWSSEASEPAATSLPFADIKTPSITPKSTDEQRFTKRLFLLPESHKQQRKFHQRIRQRANTVGHGLAANGQARDFRFDYPLPGFTSRNQSRRASMTSEDDNCETPDADDDDPTTFFPDSFDPTLDC